MFPFMGGGGLTLMLAINLDGHMRWEAVRSTCSPGSSPAGWKCEFVRIWHAWPFFLLSHLSRVRKRLQFPGKKKTKEKPHWNARFIIGKIGNLNELLSEAQQRAESRLRFPLMSCVRAIPECSDRGTKEGGSRDVHSSAPPPPTPPFLKSGTVNQSQVNTRRIRSARVSLIGLMGFTPDCLLFSIKRPTAGGITAGVIQSYCWQSRRAPNTRQLFQITVKISVSQ